MIIGKTLNEYIKQNVCNKLEKEHSQRPSNDNWMTMTRTVFLGLPYDFHRWNERL